MRYCSRSLPLGITLRPTVITQPYQNHHHINYPNRLPMTTSTAKTTIQPSFSANADIPTLSTALSTLLQPTGRWNLTPNGNGVERTFRFKTFKKTWEFMNAVAEECKVKKHHPEWSNVYNTTFVRWTTHEPAGLSAKDVEMARFCDEQAAVFGEVVSESTAGQEGGVGRELADRVAVEGGDCCVPKPKAKA